MNQCSGAIDYTLWHDDFFPPATLGRNLKRIAGMLAVFLIWVMLSVFIAIGFMRLGFSLETAGLFAVIIPPGILIVLNIAGVFNRPRSEAQTLKNFQKWLGNAAGQRHGLQLAHVAEMQPLGNQLVRITVTAEWLQQSSDKRLADVNYWYVLWNWCRNEGGIQAKLELLVMDATEQCVGAAHSSDGGTVWVLK